LNRKLSNKDKKDWKNFLSRKDKIYNKDKSLSQKNTNKELIKTIDLHGLSLENANKVINDFINKCFHNNINRIIVVTGKGLRSNNIDNPYVSKDLSILKHSVPEYIKSNINLMKMIKNIKEADTKDGGSGAFNIYLKKIKE
jgi:DNA-nicking Smr family endonuclease